MVTLDLGRLSELRSRAWWMLPSVEQQMGSRLQLILERRPRLTLVSLLVASMWKLTAPPTVNLTFSATMNEQITMVTVLRNRVYSRLKLLLKNRLVMFVGSLGLVSRLTSRALMRLLMRRMLMMLRELLQLNVPPRLMVQV